MPIYNGHSSQDVLKSITYIQGLQSKGALYRVTEMKNITGAQRGYLHVVLGIVAMSLGESIDTVKQEYYKKIVNNDVYAVAVKSKVTGQWSVTYRSSENIPAEIIGKTIKKFVTWVQTDLAKLTGMVIAIPPPENKEALASATKAVYEYEERYGIHM